MNQTYLKKLGGFLTLVVLGLCTTPEAQAQKIAQYSFPNSNGNEDSLSVDAQPANATFFKMRRGSGLTYTGTSGSGTFVADGWSTGALDANDYFSFKAAPAAGYKITIDSIKLDERRSGTGIRNWAVRSSLDNYTADLATFNVPDDTNTRKNNKITLGTAFDNLTTGVAFRIYGYTAEAAGGTWRIDSVEVYGAIAQISAAPSPTVNFASATSTVAENVTGGTLNIPVTITNPSATAATTVTVAVSTTPGTATSGTDFTVTTGTLTFPAAGTTNQNAVLTITDDAIFEGAETIILSLTNPSTGAVIGTANTHTVTITDNETAPTISFGTPVAATVGENAGAVNIPVTLSGASSAAVTVQVALATAPGTATTGSDYTFTSPATVTIAAGATTGNAVVTIIDDAAVESTETIALILQNAGTGATLGTTNQAYTLSITDNDVATANPVLSFQTPASTVAENVAGGTITIPVTIASPSATNPTTVTIAVSATPGTATAGTDYTLTTTSVTFPAGSSANQNVTVTITDDAIFEGNETLAITLQNPTNSATLGATSTHTVTITDNDVAPVIIFGTPVAVTVQENAGTVNVPVTISNASTTPVTVQVALATPAGTASATSDFTFATQTLTFPANTTATRNATVTIINDKLIEGNETILLTLQTPTGGTIGTANAYTITIVSDDVIPTRTVAQITTNNATTGLPDSMNVKVKLIGTLYGVNQRTTGLQLTLIDATGGVGIFTSSATVVPTVAPVEGDRVRAIGTVGHFNGLTQLTLDSIVVLANNQPLITPALVNGPLTEAHESELITIANPVTLVTPSQWVNTGTGFTAQVTDGTNTYDMRVVSTSNIWGTPAPTGPFMLTGIGGQFDSSDPRDSGYQITPRRLADIVLVTGLRDDLSNAVSIYPNPVSHTLNLNLQALNAKKATVSVVNALGQVVANVPANATELNVSAYPAGVYTLRIATAEAVVTKRFVKIN